MARIFRTDIYDYNTLPTFEDYVIGTDPNDSKRTRNYRIADIIGLADGTSTRFTTLYDTPENYEGQAGKIVMVNGGEDGLIFGDGDFVTLDTVQTITAGKIFSGIINFTGNLTNMVSLNATRSISSNLWKIGNNDGSNLPTIATKTGFVVTDYYEGVPSYFFGKISTGTSTGGVFSDIDGGFLNFQGLTEQRRYTFPNKTGTIALLEDIPEIPDISTRPAFVKYEPATPFVDVGQGLGHIEVGNFFLFPDDLKNGDVFNAVYTASWIPRNGKSIEVDNLVLKINDSGTASAFSRLDNPLSSLSGNISISVDLTVYIIDVVEGDIFYKYSVSIIDYISNGEKNVNMKCGSFLSTGNLISSQEGIHASLRYIDSGPSEGSLRLGEAIITRINN